jgi:hypothetical protein
MTSRRLRTTWTTLVAALLWPGLPAWSDSLASVKNLVEACGDLDADLTALLQSEVALVDAGAVSRNGGDSYRLTTQVYTVGAGTYALCPDSRFYGQQMVFGLPFRSAVQVGPDLVLTAWHGSTNGITPPLYAIFGLRYRLANGRCVPPDLERVPATDVYSVIEVVADGLGPAVSPHRDFLLLRLDRDAGGRFPRIRRSGQGRGDAGHQDRVTMISLPDRLAAKVDLAGRLAGNSDLSYTGPQVENIHPLQWSSGGMLYNRDAEVLETVVRSSVSARYANSPGGCWSVIQADGAWATNDSVADFAQNIPAFELLVTPLNAVVHEGLVGGPLSNPTTTRTIEAPVTAPGSIAYGINGPDTSADGPELLVTFGGPSQGSLAPGAGFDVEETVDAAGVPCGEYERTYSITDATHGFTDVVRHVFHIQCR